jgi:predicted ester cyclase
MSNARNARCQGWCNERSGRRDKIATRGYFTGTHSGKFMNIPATGKQVRMSYIDIWRVEKQTLKRARGRAGR